MRNTFIGLGAAAAIIVVIFILSRLIPHPQMAQQAQQQVPAGPSLQEVEAQANQVQSGFNGQAQIGKWTLMCGKEAKPASDAAPASAPDTLNADGSSDGATPAPAPAKKAGGIEFQRCGAILRVHPRNNPKGLALAAVVRRVKDPAKDRIAFILHVPPLTKAGGKVIVALTEKEVIALPVLNCDKGQCVAFGVLEQKVYQAIMARPGVAVVVPIMVGKSSGQRMVIPLSMLGLSQTIDAMKRVE